MHGQPAAGPHPPDGTNIRQAGNLRRRRGDAGS